jgi:hypothetical protein
LNTPEKALYDRAKTLAQDGSGDCAFLFDLSRLDGIDDPVLSKAASDVIDARIGETKAEAFALSGHRWMYLGGKDAIDAIAAAVTALSGEMAARKLGEIRNVRFDLSRHADQFLDQCARIAKEQGDLELEPAQSSGSAEEFIDLIKIKARLQGVDFSPMVRHRAIWHADAEHPSAHIADQIMVQPAAVKKLFGIDLESTDWVGQKIESLFSRNLVWSLLREYRHGGRTKPPAWIPVTPDLLTLPEMRSAFAEMHATAVITAASSEILIQAAHDGEQAKIPLILILPPGETLPDTVPDYFHFILAQAPPAAADWASRWVLTSDDEDIIQSALTMGVQYFAGSKAPELPQSDSARSTAAMPRARRDGKAAPRRAEVEDEAQPAVKTGLFSRVRSWLGPQAPPETNPESK